jgi:photosystem II stability/assembly factor-like uncharacterized protein
MKKFLVVCFLLLSIGAALSGADTTTIKSLKTKFGPSFSSFFPGEEQHKHLLNRNTISTSSRGTTWKSYPIFGGEMTSIAIDPNNLEIVYVGTRDAGVYKTRNGGTFWNLSRNGLTFCPIRSLAINPQNSGILYAGTDYDGIWKSTDSGAAWFKSSNGLDEDMIVFDIVIDPNNPEIIYAELVGGGFLNFGNIYKSKDGGANWAMSDNGIPPLDGNYKNKITSLTIDPSNSAILYAGTSYPDVFKSTDSGKTWISIDGLSKAPVALAVDPHHSGRVGALTTFEVEGNYYIYNGSDWELKSGSHEYSNYSFPAYLYYHPTDTSVIYSSGRSFAKSVDGGENWEDYLGWGGNTECSHVPDIAFNSSTPDTIFAATDILFDYDGGVFKSTNQGENWNECSNGITATVIRSVAIDPQNPDRIYVVGGDMGHFYRTENGGTTWIHEDFNVSEITDIKVDPANSANIYAASYDFYKSTDYGDNFVAKSGVERPGCIAINPLSTNTIYVGSGNLGYGVYKSSDYGETWVQKDTATLPRVLGEICHIVAIAIDPKDTSNIWLGTQAGIVKSINGGNSWEVKGFSDDKIVNSIAMNPDNSNEILAGVADISSGNCYIYKSINGGETWVEKSTPFGTVMDIKYDPRNYNYVYAAIFGYGVLRSADGGENWYDYYCDGFFYPVIYSMDIAQGDSVLLVVGTYGSGVYYIHPELSGIDEQAEKGKGFFLQESSFELSGTTTSICFNLPEAGIVSLKLFDIMGREVAKILNEYRPAGKNEVRWDTGEITSGIYFYQLEYKGVRENKKVAFIR